MPPPLLFDLSQIDLSADPLYTKEDVLKVNPQSYEMQQLDGLLWVDKEKRLMLGYKDVTDKEFWVRGHIPGRPLMPGVIMIECAAQLLSFYIKEIYDFKGFIGFTGVDSTKFRSQVVPGQRLLLLGHILKIQSRKYVSKIQGVADGNFIFETIISGMAV